MFSKKKQPQLSSSLSSLSFVYFCVTHCYYHILWKNPMSFISLRLESELFTEFYYIPAFLPMTWPLTTLLLFKSSSSLLGMLWFSKYFRFSLEERHFFPSDGYFKLRYIKIFNIFFSSITFSLRPTLTFNHKTHTYSELFCPVSKRLLTSYHSF